MGRTRSPLEEEECPPPLLLQLLRGQAVEAWRADGSLQGPDRVRRVVEQDRSGLAVGPEEGEDRKLGVERPRGTNGVVARADPEDRTVLQEQAAVLADRRLLAEPEPEGRRRKLFVRRDGRRDDLLPQLPRERLVAGVAVDRHRRGSVVGVGAVDEDVVERDPRLLRDGPRRGVE